MDREKDETSRPLRAPELARRFDAVEPRHGDVEHDDIRMKPLRLGEEQASLAHRTDDEKFVSQRVGRQCEHRLMIIGQQHTRALRGARAAAERSFDHGAISKPPILLKNNRNQVVDSRELFNIPCSRA